MKKLLLLAIIGWMSVLAVHAQGVIAFHGGYGFTVNHGAHPSGFTFALDSYKNHGMFGAGVKFPSHYDGTFTIDAHGGLNFLWDNFMLSPHGIVGYSHSSGEEVKTSQLQLGAGLQACYKVYGPLGIFTKVSYLAPVRFEPLGFGSGAVTISFGLTMFWFR